MAEHEYSIVGHSRSKLGMWIAFAAGTIAGALASSVGWALPYLRGWQLDIPEVVLWPLGGSAVFVGLFFLFDKYVWRIARLRAVIGIPDISGTWSVSGQSFDVYNQPKCDWSGKIEITQCYEKITVHLQTSQSSSQSVSAAIVGEGRAGYRLIYGYRNQPKPGESDMQAHLGHCDLLFSPDLAGAEGSYFNGGGRRTQGIMILKKEADK